MQMAHVAKSEDADFIVLCAGLIDYKEGWLPLKRGRIAEAIEEQKIAREIEMDARKAAKLAKEDRIPVDVETQPEVRARVHLELVEEMAGGLAKAIPVIENDAGKPIKIYITTSPANNYDGPVGYEIAERLGELRSDIFVWDPDSARFPLKHSKKVLWILNPTKASWRGDYYSTAADRLVKDKEKQTAQKPPDVWVVGTGGSAINRPAGGELSTQRISVPVLHRLQEINTSENQVGICTVEISADSNFHKVRVYNFKDMMRDERDFIPDPEGATRRQLAILAQLRKEPSTIGMLEDALPWGRSTIQKDIEKYNATDLQPKIILRKNKNYDIESTWLQFKMRYSSLAIGKLNRSTILAFSCLHAGYRTTQYKWFLKRLPILMSKHDVDAIVDAGDNIAGLEHDLDHGAGELIAFLKTYSQQEYFAGEMIATIVVQYFQERFDKCLAKRKGAVTKKQIENIVKKSLIPIYLQLGNHDAWVEKHGFIALDTLRKAIKSYVAEGIREHLATKGQFLPNVREMVDEHVHYGSEHMLGTITMSTRHIRNGRMTTSSGRAQQTLNATKGQVVVLGNYHVKIAVHEWNHVMGQRFILQVGTIASGTDFESNMNKLVDTGVGIAKIYSDPNNKNRIYLTEVIWDSPSSEEIIEYSSDEDMLNEFRKELGI
ncbi:MAG: hypothetical protein WD712_02405 [Candidatus Spechtbacterales bacterium]